MAALADPSIGEQLKERLNSDADFQRSTRWFDGSILLQADDGECWLKVYRGQVIDLMPFTPPLGYTFKLTGSDQTWEWLASGERHFSDLMTPGVRHFDDDPELKTLGQMISDFKLEGNLMEASRLTEAIHVIAHTYEDVAR